MSTYFLTLTIGIIFTQTIHAFWTIKQFNKVEPKWLGAMQNVVFCAIISLGILGYVLIGKHYHAMAGAVVEIAINLYYYNHQFKGQGQSTTRQKVRKNWVAYMLSFVIPILIYFFSLEIAAI